MCDKVVFDGHSLPHVYQHRDRADNNCCLSVILWRGLGAIPTIGTRMVHLQFVHTPEEYSVPVFKYICSFTLLAHHIVSVPWEPKILRMLLSLWLTFWEIIPNIEK